MITSKNLVWAGKDDKSIDMKTIEELTNETNELIFEARASTSRSLEKIQEMKVLGEQILQKLDEDERQISQMQEDVHTIQTNAKESNRTIRSIKSVGGTLLNGILPSPKAVRSPLAMKKLSKESPRKERKDRKKEKEFVFMNEPGLDSETIQGADENICQIEKELDRIRRIALQIGDSLASQNQALDELSGSTSIANQKMKKLTRKTKKLG